MNQAEDTRTAELPGLDVAPEPGDSEPAPVQLGAIARSLAGLPDIGQPPAPRAPLPAWRLAFEAAITADPAGKKGVAERLGVSRPYVSRVATGDLQRRPSPQFIARVEALLMQVVCPHLHRPLTPAECHGYARRGYGQVNSYEVDHWRACRGCAHNAQRASVLANAAGRGHPVELEVPPADPAATATATVITPGEAHA